MIVDQIRNRVVRAPISRMGGTRMGQDQVARLAASAREHGVIVTAIVDGDATAAAKAMTDVIETGRRTRATALQSHLNVQHRREQQKS